MRPGVPRLPSTVSQFVAVSFAAITSYWGVEETTNNSPAMAGLLVSQSNQNTESQVLCPHEDQCPGEDKDQFCARKAYKRQRTQRIQRKKREQKKTEEEESEIEKRLREKWLEEQERREQKEAKDRGFTRDKRLPILRPRRPRKKPGKHSFPPGKFNSLFGVASVRELQRQNQQVTGLNQ